MATRQLQTVRSSAVVPLWRDVRVLRVAGQALFVLVLLLIGYYLYSNMMRGLARMGATMGFGFLEGNASFALAETAIPYDSGDPYWYAFLVGALNTLRVVVVGIVLATVMGFTVGLGRLSSNWLVSKLAQGYVELFRNTPLLIQLFFWYFVGVLKLPRVRDSLALPADIYLSNRGLTIPWFNLNPTFSMWWPYAAFGLVLALVIRWALGRLPAPRTVKRVRGWVALLVFLALAIGNAWILTPFGPTTPKIQGFNFAGGNTLSPEYVALVFGLVIYTGAFIAEIIRAGILAVPRGLNEASRALGLSYGQTLRLVTVPLALRVIIPPLTNQYLNLAKNSSLAIAVGYADLFYVGQTIFNQSGQTLQVIVLIMATYLLISLTIAVLMGRLNARFRLVER